MSLSAPAKSEPALVAGSPLHPTRSVETARAGSEMLAATCMKSVPSRKAESWKGYAEGVYTSAA
jgi:hypothetical protein